jgi:hypothetical protein
MRLIGCLGVVAAALALAPHEVLAQGTLTTANLRFDVNSVAATGGMTVDFEVPTATDHLFEHGWWFRIAGDAAETRFPAPDSQSYVGTVATLNWANVSARGFAAKLVMTLVQDSATSGRVQSELTLTNNTAGDLNITVFCYADIDLQPSSGNDSATLVTANDHIALTTGGGANTAAHRCRGADALRVTTFAALRNVLNDAAITNLDNGGLPFGPGDYTGAFQWTRTIPAAGSMAFVSVLAVNSAAEFLDGGCCFPATACVQLTEGDCIAQGGGFQGIGAPCSPEPCPSTCCLPNHTCISTPPANCALLGGTDLGFAVNCDDTDGDGAGDVCDGCPNDPFKFEPGLCGCGVSDNFDGDGDAIPDCVDNCPNVPNTAQTDSDNDGIGDACETPPAGQPACGACGAGGPMVVPLGVLGLMAFRQGVRRRTRR